RLHLRAGVIGNLIHFNYYQLSAEHEGEPLQERINAQGNTSTQQLFAQGQYKLSNNFTVNAGLHYLHLSLNNTSAVEPRVSAKWNITNKSSVAFGYGLHSHLQIWGVYFARQQSADVSYKFTQQRPGLYKSTSLCIVLQLSAGKRSFVKNRIVLPA